MFLRGFIFALSLSSVASPEEKDFSDLGLLEQRDFMSLAQDLFVLGQLTQSDLLTRIDQALLLEDAPFAQALTDSLLDLSQPATDARFRFRVLIDQSPSLLGDFYTQALKSLPESEVKTFENVMRRLSIEADQKRFLLRWPSLAEHTPYPGLRGYSLSSYKKIPEALENKINSNALLSWIEFLQLSGHETKPTPADLESYQMYLSFGWMAYADAINRETYNQRISEARLKAETTAAEMKWAPWEFELEDVLIERNWLIYSRLKEASLRLQPSDDINREDLLDGAQWAIKHYSQKILNLDRSLEDGRFQDLIDQSIVELEDGEASIHFRKALEDIEDGGWASTQNASFSYFKLTPNLRRLFAARVFPDLSIRESTYLLEKRLFDLSETERLRILNTSIPRADEASLAYAELNRLPLLAASPLLDAFLRKIVRSYRLRDVDELPPTHLALFDGSEVPRIEPLREEMKLMIRENRNQISSGIYPQWFIEDLMVRFFPTESHLNDEWRRYSNEWQRREILDLSLQEIDRLKTAISEAQDEGERYRFANQLAEVVTKLNERLMASPIDIDSEFSLLAAFAYGLLPHDRNDWVGVAKTAGFGIVFVTVLRFSGIKSMGTFILTDTGLHYMTGYSTWIGLWTAQGIDESLSKLHRLLSPSSAEDRMLAAEELGSMTRDMMAFGLGAEILRFSASGVRLKARRNFRAALREMHDLRAAIRSHTARIEAIKAELPRHQKQLSLLREAGQGRASTAVELETKISSLESEVAILEGRSGRRYESRLEFYSKAAFRAALQGFDFLLPGRSKPTNISSEGLWRSFDRRRSLGIRQFEDQIRALEKSMARTDRNLFLREQFSQDLLARQQLKRSLSHYSEAQRTVATRLIEAESLEAAREFSSAAQSLEAAARGSLGNFADLKLLVDSLRPPRPTGPIERIFLRGDDFIQREIRGGIFRSRPVKVPEPAQASERLFDTLRLNGKDEVRFLEQRIQRLRNSASRLPDDKRLEIEIHLRAAEDFIRGSRQLLEKIRITN